MLGVDGHSGTNCVKDVVRSYTFKLIILIPFLSRSPICPARYGNCRWGRTWRQPDLASVAMLELPGSGGKVALCPSRRPRHRPPARWSGCRHREESCGPRSTRGCSIFQSMPVALAYSPASRFICGPPRCGAMEVASGRSTCGVSTATILGFLQTSHSAASFDRPGASP